MSRARPLACQPNAMTGPRLVLLGIALRSSVLFPLYLLFRGDVVELDAKLRVQNTSISSGRGGTGGGAGDT